MAEEKENKKSWAKEDFMVAFLENQNPKHVKSGRTPTENWKSFHKAMNAASNKAGAGDITELRLAMRCGAINAQLKKAGIDEWNHPPRPRAEQPKPKSVATLALELLAARELRNKTTHGKS
jgi:hypothetical protein